MNALERDGLARVVDAGDPRVVGAAALGERARQREAALVGDVELAVGTVGEAEHGVAHDARDALVVGVGAVEDEDLQVLADLVRGEADALGGVHRGDHVGHEGGEVVVELGDVPQLVVHDRRSPAGDGADGATGGQRAGLVGRGRFGHASA